MIWIDERYAEERRKDLLREAQQAQVARQAARKRSQRPHGSRARAWLSTIAMTFYRARRAAIPRDQHI